jgi:hypothetical protein
VTAGGDRDAGRNEEALVREQRVRHGRPGEIHDRTWLGGEAHVPVHRGSGGWGGALRARDGFSGRALGLLFVAGLLLGGGLIWLGRRPAGGCRAGGRQGRK